MKSWYEIKAKADVSEIWLYDEIGIFGVGAREFIAELNALKSPKVDLHINSPGGSVFDANAIYNAIRRHPAEVTSYIDGLAASMASVIAIAGQRVVMAQNGLYLIHNPHGIAIGSSGEMRKTADILDKVREAMVGAYVGKSGQSEATIGEWMDAETGMDADEALEAGFVDEIGSRMDMAACARFLPVLAQLGFQHVPRALSDAKPEPSQRDVERALREAGISAKFSKALLAKGFPDPPRDAAQPVAEDPPRDAAQPTPKRDRVADLLIRAEVAAPSIH